MWPKSKNSGSDERWEGRKQQADLWWLKVGTEQFQMIYSTLCYFAIKISFYMSAGVKANCNYFVDGCHSGIN